MEKTIHFDYHIEPIWEIVHQIRDKVEASLQDYSEELRYASKLAASELIENAVKYGISVSNGTGITFDFAADEERIVITVSNRAMSLKDLDDVRHFIDQINASENVEALYLSRLHLLMENPNLEKTQLGLFRIAYEARCTLQYTIEQDILTVTATRQVSSEHQKGGDA